MTLFAKYFLIIILAIFIPQSNYAKTSTQASLIDESELFGIENSIEITESDFTEEIESVKKKYFWTVNLKFGPYLSINEAQQAAEKIKINPYFSNNPLTQLTTNPQDIKYFLDTRTNKNKYSWVVLLTLGPYQSKKEARQVSINEKINKGSFKVSLGRENTLNKKLTTQNSIFLESNQKSSGNILLSLELSSSQKT